MKLAELTDRWSEIERILDAAEGEITPEVEAALAHFDLHEKDKVDAYVFIVKDLRDRAKLGRAQAAELTNRARVRDARADWLQGLLADHMARRGLKRIEGQVRYAQWQKNGGKLPIELVMVEGGFPAHYQRVTVEPDLDKIRVALEDGSEDGTYARFGERGESLRLY